MTYLADAEKYEAVAAHAVEVLDSLTSRALILGVPMEDVAPALEAHATERDRNRQQAAWCRERAYRAGETTVAPWSSPREPAWTN